MKTRVKICGITRSEDLKHALDAGADALGLVFYPASPRYVEPAKAQLLAQQIPPFVTLVGLFVNPTEAEIKQVLNLLPLQLLQFHGDETPEQCHQLASAVKLPFIRAFRVKPDTMPIDLVKCQHAYQQASAYFKALLLDTFVDSFGGSGKVFDWSLIPKELAPLVVLSGGLNVQNVTDAVRQVRSFALDISSGVEAAKGIKDSAKITAFFDAVRKADSLS